MYAYLKGTVANKTSTYLILDVQGVGYKIFTLTDLSALEKDSLKLHTSFIVRENFQALYGFITPEQRDVFELLITLSGVGPKTAMCLLSKLPLDILEKAVFEQNTALISTVPGIGKKTAERLLLELKDKLMNLTLSSAPKSPEHQCSIDAQAALMHLGFSAPQAKKAVEKALKQTSQQIDLSSLISKALQHS